jgi:Fur family ferric uptake transcriptional regulator
MVESKHTEWYDRASRALQDAGYRRGGARHALLELLDTQACARSAIEIEEALRHLSQATRTVSRASIYRILAELEALSLVTKLEVGQATWRFEATRGGKHHHHHLVCDRCGTLTPFADEALERELVRVSTRVPLAVAEHEVILRGECERCADDAYEAV